MAYHNALGGNPALTLAPLEWAMTQISLGSTLMRIGER